MGDIDDDFLFQDILEDLDTSAIPIQYVHSIEIFYKDGSSFVLYGDDLLSTQDYSSLVSPHAKEKLRNVESIQVKVDLIKLQFDVSLIVDEVTRNILR